jgi:hypothetical protein
MNKRINQMGKINEELLLCAKINFENLERNFPAIRDNPYYTIAKMQLDDGLGEESSFPEEDINNDQ